jgi:hypothetical protein
LKSDRVEPVVMSGTQQLYDDGARRGYLTAREKAVETIVAEMLRVSVTRQAQVDQDWVDDFGH